MKQYMFYRNLHQENCLLHVNYVYCKYAHSFAHIFGGRIAHDVTRLFYPFILSFMYFFFIPFNAIYHKYFTHSFRMEFLVYLGKMYFKWHSSFSLNQLIYYSKNGPATKKCLFRKQRNYVFILHNACCFSMFEQIYSWHIAAVLIYSSLVFGKASYITFCRICLLYHH